MKMLAKKAVQNPDTLKPLTRDETSIIISALMTSRKKPNVTNVSGSVSMTRTGFKIAFAKPSSRAEIINEDVSVNLIPLNTALVAQSDSEVINQCSRNGVKLSNIFMCFQNNLMSVRCACFSPFPFKAWVSTQLGRDQLS